MDPLFELKVKQAFSKVKEDITSLKQDLNDYKALLRALIDKLGEKSQDNNQKSSNFPPVDKKSSTGNKGVYAFTHSFNHSLFTHSNTQSPIHSQDQDHQTLTSDDFGSEEDQNLSKNNQKPSNLTLTFDNLPTQNNTNYIQNSAPHPLQTLTNKEFIVFLTIYRLEKELPRVTYVDIANKLTLTSGCIRSYITSLIRKKAPVVKSKINNKITILSIDPSFRSITSEQKLLNLYYQNDPHQSTLL